MLEVRHDIEGILREARAGSRHAHRAIGTAAERRDALCEQIAVLLDDPGDLVEELVQGDEAGPRRFQWACFTCVKRSIVSARRACNSGMTSDRMEGARSILLVYMSTSWRGSPFRSECEA
jgi:hypothetical protein